MNVKKYSLCDFENATKDFHISCVSSQSSALRIHMHDYFQIYFMVGGKLIHHLESRKALLSVGDLFILPPNIPHFIELAEEKGQFYFVSFTMDFFQKSANKRILDFLTFLQRERKEDVEPQISLSYEDSVFIQTLLERILKEFSGDKPDKQEIVKEAMCVVLSLLARVCFEKEESALISKENKRIVMHCIEYIKEHFDEEITLSDMAKCSAMSKGYFCTIFNSIVGMPFKEYLNRYRIEKAAELISSGEKVSVAANLCGYSEFSTFYRNFKKYGHISPSEFAGKTKKKKQSETNDPTKGLFLQDGKNVL